MRIDWPRVRRAAPAVALIAGTVLFLRVLHGHYPIQHWLLWRYAGYWILALVWAAGCLSSGHFVVRRLLRIRLPARTHFTVAFPAGVLAASLITFGAGLAGALGTAFFVALPGVLLAATGRDAYRLARRFVSRARACRRPPAPPLLRLVLGFGLVALVVVYLPILTPQNVQHDAHWKHLVLAEQWSVAGRIPRSPEGWQTATQPNLAALVYVWAFLLPAGRLFDRIELAAHMEFVLFLFTILAIGPLLRRLVPRARAEHAWVARFLFPGIFVYDSNLSLGADHVAALFAIPIWLTLLELGRAPRVGAAVLLGALVSGAALVKITAALLLASAPLVALIVAPIVRPGRRREWLRALGAFAATSLLLTAPYWFKNWIWYGDPLYPELHRHFDPSPWVAGSSDLFEFGYKRFQLWQPRRTLDGALETLSALVSFSFVAHDWPEFHGAVPVFGSLFTLLIPAILFLRAGRHLWSLIAAVHGSLLIWYVMHHQERYLQTVVPWMAACTAAMITLVWRTGRLARVAVGVLLTVQVAWAAHALFIPSHAMTSSLYASVFELFSAGHREEYDSRFAVSEMEQVGGQLPQNARVLVHEQQKRLGLAVVSVTDFPGEQFLLSWAELHSPAEARRKLAGLGITHVLWQHEASLGWDSVAGDISFFSFALRHRRAAESIGTLRLAQLPDTAPERSILEEHVAVLSCPGAAFYEPGLYRVADLVVPVFGKRRLFFPPPRERLRVPPGQDATRVAAELIARASVVVTDPTCRKPKRRDLIGLTLAARRERPRDPKNSKAYEIWLRLLPDA